MLIPNRRKWTLRPRKANLSSFVLTCFFLHLNRQFIDALSSIYRTRMALVGVVSENRLFFVDVNDWGWGFFPWEVSMSRALSGGVHFLCTSVPGVLWVQPDCGSAGHWKLPTPYLCDFQFLGEQRRWHKVLFSVILCCCGWGMRKCLCKSSDLTSPTPWHEC